MAFPPTSGGNRPYNRSYNNNSNQVRKNERIRAREVRLIGPDGSQIGIVTREEALVLAKQHDLDLVEIAATATPPVCRILDYGKYMYEISKKAKDKTHVTKVKIIKMRMRIETHDYMVKIRHSEEFLFKGNKLRLTLQFRGREMEHKELGYEVVQRAVNDLIHVGAIEGGVKPQGRSIVATLNPLPVAKRKLKFNEKVSEHDDLVDDSDDADEHDEDAK
ncbi:MAG: translation initiation factor IF-3 [Verrucomicrobiota bacterium]|nr:translation initiation factor IF-3 [Verrucomicrobiota bacterium]